ncbi:MAG: RagB/SusD family nutrient uptake outer membrane protein [Paludibacter sp.]|nr:RagB/SusD family nutrient uptake outer membrane protein [Paludibacter sp.]
MKKIKYILLVVFASAFASCESFLDTLPDNRTQIDTEKKISQLLVSAYPVANYSVLAELSSDNYVDNNVIVPAARLSSFERMHDEIFSWNEVTSSTQQDSPSYVWERFYAAISAANHSLKAIEELELQNPDTDLASQKGEALLCRAYGHFILVNIFCQAYKDEMVSKSDIGIPYMTEPETSVNPYYKRESVQSVYEKIQHDLEAGFALLTDQRYSVLKYRFNKKAAAAFAARFYLYKREYQKVVDYADQVLTANPASLMRDWTLDLGDNYNAFGYNYISADNSCNLMLLPTYSLFDRIFGTRYGLNGDALKGTFYNEAGVNGPTWLSILPGFKNIYGTEEYGAYMPKTNEMFEYTDKVAGIGYAHVVRAEFTAEETLLCRAEALIYLNRFNDAVADLQVWNSSHLAPNVLTESIIKNFYVASNTLFVKTLNNDKMSSSFAVTAAQRPFIHCVLHFRRIETMFDGYRWFDIKRYGIEIEHNIAGKGIDKLVYNDPRRAIQLPQEVISAGLDPNPRKITPVSAGNYKKME